MRGRREVCGRVAVCRTKRLAFAVFSVASGHGSFSVFLPLLLGFPGHRYGMAAEVLAGDRSYGRHGLVELVFIDERVGYFFMSAFLIGCIGGPYEVLARIRRVVAD